MAVDDRPLALVFRSHLLPRSKIFIRNQVRALRRAALSVAARERACKRFDLNKCTASLESFYDQSVADCSAKPGATAFRPQPQAR